MFRDPQVFRFLREKVLPMLATYPHVRIWQAGCATGKEVYSLAILLHEEGLAGRFRIYATDMNDAALETARQGIYPVSEMREYAENYLKSGGRATLSDYYHARYESVIFDGKLRESVLFANHNLVTDGPFNEMHLILCRNVLIYFSRPLQDRVLGLLHASLVPRGFLCLGTKESLRFSSVVEHFEMVDSRTKIFRLRP